MAGALFLLSDTSIWQRGRRCKKALAFIPALNCIKVCMRYTQNGENTCNVFYVDMGNEPTVATMTTVAEVFKGWWLDFMQDFTNVATSLQAIEVTDVSSESDDGIIYTTGLPQAGLANGGPLPNHVTVATKLLSGFTGRSRRGRKYMVGMDNSHITADKQHIGALLQTGLQTAYTELIDLLVTEGVNWVIASFISNGVPRSEALVTNVASVVTNLVIDSQRRRLPERGS